MIGIADALRVVIFMLWGAMFGFALRALLLYRRATILLKELEGDPEISGHPIRRLTLLPSYGWTIAMSYVGVMAVAVWVSVRAIGEPFQWETVANAIFFGFGFYALFTLMVFEQRRLKLAERAVAQLDLPGGKVRVSEPTFDPEERLPDMADDHGRVPDPHRRRGLSREERWRRVKRWLRQ